MLEVQDLHVAYGDSSIVQGVSLQVPDGRIAAVFGRDGVGKTTLIRGIAGLTAPRRGRVILNGEDVAGAPAHAIARRGVGLVPQGRACFPRSRCASTSPWGPARPASAAVTSRECSRSSRTSAGDCVTAAGSSRVASRAWWPAGVLWSATRRSS